MLGEVETRTRSAFSHDGKDAPEVALSEYSRTYTMQAERDVHEGLFQAAGGTPHVQASTQSEFPERSVELEENVEFF